VTIVAGHLAFASSFHGSTGRRIRQRLLRSLWSRRLIVGRLAVADASVLIKTVAVALVTSVDATRWADTGVEGHAVSGGSRLDIIYES